jgi:hypothetical protein
VDLFRHGAAEVVEGFAQVRRVVVGFVGVLGAVISGLDQRVFWVDGESGRGRDRRTYET